MRNNDVHIKKEEDVMRYKNIIFDLDGTLLNTIDDLTSAVNYVMNYFGYDTYSTDRIKQFVGNGIHKLMERAVPQGMDNSIFDKAYEMFKLYYTSNCKNATRPYDGIESMLEKLKDLNCNMAVVSNKNDQAVKKLCREFFSSYIGTAIGQSETTNKKPAPDTVFKAMEEFDAVKHETLYVGDSEVDKMTADNAGVDCVLVSWGFRARKDLEKLNPDVIIDNPVQLLDIVIQ